MKSHIFFILLAVIAIAGVSVAFCIIQEPEYVQIKSDDGIVNIEGLTRQSRDVTVAVLGDYSYQIEPSSASFQQPLTLTFNLSQTHFNSTIAVYKYNQDLMMWEAVSSAIDPSAEEVVLEQSELGKYTIKQYSVIDAPDFVDTFDSVLTMAPKNTVGYELAVGFIDSNGSVIRISKKTQLGGCDGIVAHGNREELSQMERKTRVYVDSVEQEVDFLIIGRWFVDDEIGCKGGQVLMSTQEM
ncbi:MAG: hypothetical protein ABIA83_00640 [Patescibacteria group bacterium]